MLDENKHKSFILPGSRPHYNPSRPGQVEHIFLDLVLDIPGKSFSGTCYIDLCPIHGDFTSLTLDAVNLNIQEVTIDSVVHPYNYDGEQLHINLLDKVTAQKPLKIAINYQVEEPQRGLYFITPNQDYPHKPTQVWTQGEDEDSRFWFPCFDYPGQLASSEIRVSVPTPLVAISNGELLGVESLGDRSIYHWKQREIHPTYLITLAVGNFAEIKDSWQGKDVTYYVEKGWEEQAKLSMGNTPEMIGFYSQKFAYDYPYPKYAQICVDDFIFGGMENTSTTILTDRCLLDQRAALDNRNTESLVTHELAHQWFGDLVVIKHWSHAWIKEGMASYCEVLWTEHRYGKVEGDYYLLNEARSYLAEDSDRYRRPIVTNIYREAIELYDRHLYEKGACVYHMIRGELGEELFDRAIQTFVNNNAHKTVETIDLLRAIDQSTGHNLAYLFDQYVFRGGHPDFKVSYSWDNDHKLAKLTVTQTQARGGSNLLDQDLFDLNIPIAFGYIKPDQPELMIKKIRIYEPEQVLYFPLDRQPDFISFDAGNYFLKTISLEYPLPELKNQILHDPDPISRIYAGEAIAKKGNLEAVKILVEALEKEQFWGVKVEIVQQLATIKLNQVIPNLIRILKDENPRVRRAAIESLTDIKTEDTYQAIKQIVESGDPSYYVEAIACRVLGGMVSSGLKNHQDEVISLLDHVLQNRQGWNEIVRGGAIAGLSKINDGVAALDLILHYTTPGTPQALRLTAIRGLGTISQGNNQIEKILEKLKELSRETFFLTQVSVVNALGQMETPKAIAILHGLATQSPDGRVKRIAEESIHQVQRKIGADLAVKQLREELEELKKSHQDLKSRLENLDSRRQ